MERWSKLLERDSCVPKLGGEKRVEDRLWTLKTYMSKWLNVRIEISVCLVMSSERGIEIRFIYLLRPIKQ